MKMKLGIAAACAAFTMALAVGDIHAAPPATGVPAAAAKDCKASVTGTGSAKANTPIARAKAEMAWSDAARNAYGQGFGMWIKAESRSMTCVITGRTPKTHTCTAIAQPCK